MFGLPQYRACTLAGYGVIEPDGPEVVVCERYDDGRLVETARYRGDEPADLDLGARLGSPSLPPTSSPPRSTPDGPLGADRPPPFLHSALARPRIRP